MILKDDILSTPSLLLCLCSNSKIAVSTLWRGKTPDPIHLLDSAKFDTDTTVSMADRMQLSTLRALCIKLPA